MKAIKGRKNNQESVGKKYKRKEKERRGRNRKMAKKNEEWEKVETRVKEGKEGGGLEKK